MNYYKLFYKITKKLDQVDWKYLSAGSDKIIEECKEQKERLINLLKKIEDKIGTS